MTRDEALALYNAGPEAVVKALCDLTPIFAKPITVITP
jgi:hypothetical protein